MSAAASAAALTSGVSRDATVLIALSHAARSSAVDARSVAVRWRGPLTTNTWPLDVSDVCTAIAAASRSSIRPRGVAASADSQYTSVPFSSTWKYRSRHDDSQSACFSRWPSNATPG